MEWIWLGNLGEQWQMALLVSSPFCSAEVPVCYSPVFIAHAQLSKGMCYLLQLSEVFFCAMHYDYVSMHNLVLQPQADLQHLSWTDLLQTGLQHFSQTDLPRAHLTPAVS